VTDKIRLNFRVGVSDDRKRWFIDDLPEDVWDVFVNKSKGLMPEKGDKAWASVLSEVIANVVDDGQQTFIMTGIPHKALDNLRILSSSAGLNKDGLYALVLDGAMREKLSIIKFNVDELKDKQSKRMVVMINVPEKSLERLTEIIRTIEPEQDFAGFLGRMMESAYSGTLEFSPYVPKENKETPKST